MTCPSFFVEYVTTPLLIWPATCVALNLKPKKKSRAFWKTSSIGNSNSFFAAALLLIPGAGMIRLHADTQPVVKKTVFARESSQTRWSFSTTTRSGLANEGLIKGEQHLNSRAAASMLDKRVREIQTI